MMKTGDATGFDLEPKDDVWAPFPNPLPELERFQYWPAHVDFRHNSKWHVVFGGLSKYAGVSVHHSHTSYFDARELIPFASGLQRYQTVLDALALKPTPDQVAPYQKFLQAVDDVLTRFSRQATTTPSPRLPLRPARPTSRRKEQEEEEQEPRKPSIPSPKPREEDGGDEKGEEPRREEEKEEKKMKKEEEEKGKGTREDDERARMLLFNGLTDDRNKCRHVWKELYSGRFTFWQCFRCKRRGCQDPEEEVIGSSGNTDNIHWWNSMPFSCLACPAALPSLCCKECISL